jgi:hypothetical protein
VLAEFPDFGAICNVLEPELLRYLPIKAQGSSDLLLRQEQDLC